MSNDDVAAPHPADPYAKAKIKLLDATRGIAYVEAGTGDGLVLIHGSLCDYRYWRPQLDALAAHYHVIAPSLRHHWPRLPSSVGTPYTWAAHTEQVTAFLHKLAIPRLHLVGHSRGAAVAYQVALANPGLVSSLTLVDPGGPNEQDGSGNLSAEVLATRIHATQLIETGEVDEGLRIFVDSTSRPGFWDRSAAVFQNMARQNAGTLAPQIADPLPVYRAQEARTIACPTLLVQGERSPTMYRRNADLLAQWMPQASAITMTGASHGMTWSHPQAFHRQLLAFLAS